MSECYRCGQEGHRRRDCPEVIPLPPAPRPEGGAEHGQDATVLRFPAAASLLAANAARQVDAAEWAGKIRQTMEGTWFARPLPSRQFLTATEIARWSLRGQFRTRDTFSLPHPADFRGGLPLPAEYPVSS